MQLPITSSTTSLSPLPLRLITHNIRYATPHPFKNEEPWPTRLPLLLSELHFLTSHPSTTLICLQEVLHNQLLDILAGLNSILSSNTPSPPPSNNNITTTTTQPWSYTGVARDDGHTHGEYSPILYPTNLLHPLSTHTTWLSPTPSTPSKGWDASSIRILTHTSFLHIPSNTTFCVMSTHLDDAGSRSRYESAKIIVDTVRSYTERGVRVVLGGDFNSEVDGEAYKVLEEEGSGVVDVERVLEMSKNRGGGGGARGDSRVWGDVNTYTGFGYEKGLRATRIDFIFVDDKLVKRSYEKEGGEEEERNQEEGKKGWEVTGYAVVPNKFDDGVFVSDHRAVVADLLLH